jgi:hypothetical protein
MEKRLIEPTRGNRTIRLLSKLGQGPMIHYHKKIQALVIPWRRKGSTLKTCCERLEAKGIKTFRGRKWSPSRLFAAIAQTEGLKK